MTGDCIPQNRIIHVVISVDDSVPQPDDLRTILKFDKDLRKLVSKSSACFSNDFEFSFNGRTAHLVGFVGREIHAVCEFANGIGCADDVLQ